ncbi:hypothetical protein ACVWY3_008027 [Bradyrhizobium sp. USDA 4486]
MARSLRDDGCIGPSFRGTRSVNPESRRNFEIPDRSAFRGPSGMTGNSRW